MNKRVDVYVWVAVLLLLQCGCHAWFYGYEYCTVIRCELIRLVFNSDRWYIFFACGWSDLIIKNWTRASTVCWYVCWLICLWILLLVNLLSFVFALKGVRYIYLCAAETWLNEADQVLMIRAKKQRAIIALKIAAMCIKSINVSNAQSPGTWENYKHWI